MLETNYSSSATPLISPILQQSLWCVSRKIAQPPRRPVFPAMAGYSLLWETIMLRKRMYFCSTSSAACGSAYHKIFLTAGEIFCRSHEFYADDNCINFDEVGAFVIRPTPELINKLHS